MFSEIRIQNFKSIQDLTLKPGRVTVLIGENGSGKSNILEAIAFASAASGDKLAKPYPYNIGIRVTDPIWMTPAFRCSEGKSQNELKSNITFLIKHQGRDIFDCEVFPVYGKEDGNHSGWQHTERILANPKSINNQEMQRALTYPELQKFFSDNSWPNNPLGMTSEQFANYMRILMMYRLERKETGLSDFIIYAPENTSLRKFDDESAIEPLGTKGEGLLKLLQSFSDERLKDDLADLKERLQLFGWFEDFIIPDQVDMMRGKLQIKDRWLAPEHAIFDQRSANEGFLFVLFYFTLLMSKRTPKFFAIDNIDTALNPRLCAELIKQIVELAKKYDKQVILTTHNPAILDGLNLDDDEQRLFAVSRDLDGKTGVHRIRGPKSQHGEPVTRLSVAFLSGSLGGLPTNF